MPNSNYLNHLRVEAAKELGFSSFHKLASLSEVNNGTLSGIYTGKRKKISDSEAKALISTVFRHNSHRGWSYRYSAVRLVEILNCLRNNYAHSRNEPVPEISLSMIERWFKNYTIELETAQKSYDDPLNIITWQSSTKDVLDCLLKFSKNWEMKYDFDYLDKVQRKFEDNFSLLIKPTLKEAMSEGDFYKEVRDIYSEIRYIAHLCQKYSFTQEISRWLIDQAKFRDDIQTEIKARLMLAWTLTTEKTRLSLQTAEHQLEVVWNTITEKTFLDNLPTSDIDVIALAAELHLRWPIRMSDIGLLSLHRINFDHRLSEAMCLINDATQGRDISLRLKCRYEIPLVYQHGVYFYNLVKPSLERKSSLNDMNRQQLEQARLYFEEVLTSVDKLGWIRLEQAAYTWLATIHAALGNEQEALQLLQKVNVSCLVKRQLRAQEISDQIHGHS